MNNDTQLDIAARELEAAKIAESQAQAARFDAERKVLALVGSKEEGSETHRGNSYKIVVTGVINRTVDQAALNAVRARLSPEIFDKAFRYKGEVVVSGLKYLRDNEPELYAIAAEAVTAKPGKASITVEGIELRRAA